MPLGNARLLIASLAGWLCLAGISFAADAARPNILFLFSDDLAWQAISAYGESRHLLETPQMDRIAREGMRFDRCLVTNSICGPSRAALLTGKYSHLNGFYNNTNSRFDGAQQTFPKLLQKAGYTTAMIGKWHLESDPTGFDHWHILPGQGVYYNPPMITAKGRDQQNGYVTDIITDLSVDWLKNRDQSRPFLLMCQHKAPHREWSPALRHLGWDNDRQYPEPPTLFDAFSGRSQAVQEHDMGIDRTFTDLDAKLVPIRTMNDEQRATWDKYYGPRNAAFQKAELTGQDLVRWRYNRYMHDYLGCVKAVDESVGRLLDYLDQAGLAENTLVVCSSDQGFFLGEHGWFDKRWIFEESLRTPLLVRWPKVTKPGSVNNNIVSLIDLAETFLDVAHVPVPDDMQGHSLVPLLKGETPADWRKSFYYRYYEYPVPHHVRPHYGVVTDRYKLVHYDIPGRDDWELLDRQADPLETQNFYNDPAYRETVKELKEELARLREELKDTADPPRAAYGNKSFENEAEPPEQGGEPNKPRKNPKGI
ncbi:sulfatase family protein [Planctomicrobium piriforme]|uniref:Arylsulfatase A n=1 Tax=Planctomicrobium piriforme TaxID=1576369 RepID=A0A1I3AT03_9PLAN|nr:sulfatase [Planctomicrobium piriforme]SFH52461.1 Arylsulfatase A [Planctomicrobium piriforme]